MADDLKPKQGWWWPSNSRNAHYFPSSDNHRSLCGRWGRLSQSDDVLDDTGHGSPDNCKTCMKKREKLEDK